MGVERERLIGKVLMNLQSFVKFIRLFHCQLFALAVVVIWYIICQVDNPKSSYSYTCMNEDELKGKHFLRHAS